MNASSIEGTVRRPGRGAEAKAEQQPASFLGLGPAAAVGRPAYRGHDRARLVFEQPFEVRRLGQKIEPQLGQFPPDEWQIP